MEECEQAYFNTSLSSRIHTGSECNGSSHRIGSVGLHVRQFQPYNGSSESHGAYNHLSFHKRRFAHKDRDIRQSGKVYYDVERNEAMPFEIHTSEALVRVLGTSFQVDASAVQTAIDVVNGCVFFAASSAVNEGIELTRGMHAELQAGALKPALVEAASMNPSAWATHHFIYDDAPLESVLEELSTVFGHIITCEQQNRRLSGEFSAESLEEAVSLIEATLDINLTVR